MKTLNNLAFSLLLGLGSSLAVACSAPDKPELPDPDTAVTPQMIKAKNDVNAYLSAATAFLECNKTTRKHNDMVNEMNDVADEFNGIIRAYKARMAG